MSSTTKYLTRDAVASLKELRDAQEKSVHTAATDGRLMVTGFYVTRHMATSLFDAGTRNGDVQQFYFHRDANSSKQQSVVISRSVIKCCLLVD